MKVKNTLYLSLVITIVILLAFIFQHLSILWIGVSRFIASERPPGDISLSNKIHYLIMYPIIFTMFLTPIVFIFSVFGRYFLNLTIDKKIYFVIILLVLITLILRFAFYLFC